ncbi:MAG: phosphatase PAP2 family protein [Elusimicrobiota bacterium]|nr:phosphatase PAP2 family protein [Elusimicrobiota bacterium]
MPSARRLYAVASLMAVVIAAYTATNRLHWREPAFLPVSALDRAAPFVPGAMWVYASHFVFLPGCLLLLRGEGVFARVRAAVLSGVLLSNAVFLFWPTTIARVAHPSFLFDFIALMDEPVNCFPSQHVGLALIAAWGLRRDGFPGASLFLAWAGAISVSTVLVRQHYAADVAGGAALALLSWKLSGLVAPAGSRG